MRMIRRMVPLVLVAAGGLLVGPRVGAGRGLDVLKAVPADSHIVVVLGNWQQAGSRAARVVREFVPPGALPGDGDFTTLLAERSGLNLDRLDRSGPLGLVVHRVPDQDNAPAGVVVLLAVTDYDGFVSGNSPGGGTRETTGREGEGDRREYAETPGRGEEQHPASIIRTGDGTGLFVRQLGRFAALSDDAETLAAVAAARARLADSLAPAQSALAAADLFVHVDAAGVFATMRPRLERELGVPGEQTAVRWAMELIVAIGPDCRSLDLSVALIADGIELTALLTARDGSPMAEAFAAARRPGGPLVRDVPHANWLVLGGAVKGAPPDSELVRRLMDLLARGLGGATGQVEGAVRLVEQAGRLNALIERKSVSLTTASKDGRPVLPVTVTGMAETSDGPAALQAARGFLTELAGLLSAQWTVKAAGAGAGRPAGPSVRLTLEAETIGGVKVDRMVVDVRALAGAIGPGAAIIPRLLGEGEIALRVGLKDKRLIVTLGGGVEAFEAALSAVEANPEADPVLALAKGRVPEGSSGAIYLAADRVGGLLLDVLSDLLEQPLLPFPRIDAPAAMSFGTAGQTASLRLFVPIALIDGIGRYAREACGGVTVPAGAGPDARPSTRAR